MLWENCLGCQCYLWLFLWKEWVLVIVHQANQFKHFSSKAGSPTSAPESCCSTSNLSSTASFSLYVCIKTNSKTHCTINANSLNLPTGCSRVCLLTYLKQPQRFHLGKESGRCWWAARGTPELQQLESGCPERCAAQHHHISHSLEYSNQDFEGEAPTLIYLAHTEQHLALS